MPSEPRFLLVKIQSTTSATAGAPMIHMGKKNSIHLSLR
jgi:hypothetical protein